MSCEASCMIPGKYLFDSILLFYYTNTCMYVMYATTTCNTVYYILCVILSLINNCTSGNTDTYILISQKLH